MHVLNEEMWGAEGVILLELSCPTSLHDTQGGPQLSQQALLSAALAQEERPGSSAQPAVPAGSAESRSCQRQTA